MQITISGAAALAVTVWVTGTTLISLAAFSVWEPGYVGVALMPIGSASWIHHRIRIEARQLISREDAAFNFGREAAVRSIR